jgi:excisionase family DNA binding protein
MAARIRRSYMNASPPTKLYTIAQIAECVEVSTRTVRRWIKDKVLGAHRVNGVLRVSEADFRAFATE